MERINRGAFMIQCNSCSRGWSLSKEDYKRPEITCQDPECGSSFSIYEGIKNGLKKIDDHIMPNSFLSNDMFKNLIEVKIGYISNISLPENIKKIYNITLIPAGPFIAGATDITNEGFRLFTSFDNESNQHLVGQLGQVLMMLNYKANDYDLPWLHLLQYSFEQLRSEELITSILLSEIALESFVDSLLTEGYLTVGLDKDSISRMLVATDLPIKVNPLMYNLYGVKLASYKSYSTWEKKVLKWRNQIAHGTKVNATKEEAVLVYETIVDSIFHFIEGIDNYYKQNGIKEGFLF